MVVAALFVAMSIVLGKVLSVTAGAFRISFENLPVLMAGLFFGPAVGMCVGAAADIIGCIIVGYTINPIITLGAICIGFLSGFVSHATFHCDFSAHKLAKIAVSVFTAHIFGSMLIKSVGMAVYFGYTIEVLALRIPLYIGIGALETMIIFLLMSNRGFNSALERLCKK